MANTLNRRTFIKNAAAALAFSGFPHIATAAAPRIAVVGGGFGGLTAALFLRRLLPDADIVLVERNEHYRAPPFSNFVAVGAWDEKQIVRAYDAVAAGIRVVHATAARASGGGITLADGSVIACDKAIVSPGIGFDFTATEGVTADNAHLSPHGYTGDVAALRRLLAAMPPNGTVAIIPPAGAYRCPPAPYERAGLLAGRMEKRGARGKVLIFDQKEKFAQQTLFGDGWDLYYRDRIEWFAAEAGGLVERVDAQRGRVITEFGEEQADVINYIPPQRAADIATASGLTDAEGWCPVNPATMESRQVPGVYVIGDAAAVAPLPKSATAAMGMARLAAADIARIYGAAADDDKRVANFCFSYLSEENAFAERGEYLAGDDGMERLSLSLTARHAGGDIYRNIAQAGVDWHEKTLSMLFAPVFP